ncbi:MAG: hypothetical protein EYC62_03870 [Alphaproteobacteria bacterium]|nr:MAG: hypothetical protein EYC62_03870 [Alphaproteobacteria bacterium]
MLLLKAFVLGFSVAAPIGPVGMLVISRGLNQGRRSALETGLGDGLSLATYALLAALGLENLFNSIPWLRPWFCILGAIVMVYFGIKIWRLKPALQSADINSSRGYILSTYLFAMTSPATILVFAGFYSGMSIGAGSLDFINLIGFAFAVLLGSLAWWIILSMLLHWLKPRLGIGILHKINMASALVFFVFAVMALYNLPPVHFTSF